MVIRIHIQMDHPVGEYNGIKITAKDAGLSLKSGDDVILGK